MLGYATKKKFQPAKRATDAEDSLLRADHTKLVATVSGSASVVRFTDSMSLTLSYPALKRWAITDRPLSGLIKDLSIIGLGKWKLEIR